MEIGLLNFNPRSPHGERHDTGRGGITPEDFNPRSPHGERHVDFANIDAMLKFQSTLPARGATKSSSRKPSQPCDFNPRSPHGERRGGGGKSRCDHRDFNPRSPHGERPRAIIHSVKGRYNFNPRSPHGERPLTLEIAICKSGISIHAPRTGSDDKQAAIAAAAEISIHAPRTGSDQSPHFLNIRLEHFNPRSPHGERR